MRKADARLLEDLKSEFQSRKFAGGLFIALIDLFLDLGIPALRARTFEQVLARYPRSEKLSTGAKANTLVLRREGKLISLRPYYNAVEKSIRSDNKRFGYPSCAPHATQAWIDYSNWLDAFSSLSAAELSRLRASALKFILAELPSHEYKPGSVPQDPPLFEAVLQNFELASHKGEPSGAAYQSVAFGFLRADNPHLQMEIGKVRTGSKRLQRVGDVDGWDGSRLAVSAEVKQFAIRATDLPDLDSFVNDVGLRGAIGLVVALGFGDGTRERLEERGIRALDRDDVLRIVTLWDPAKQRIAVASMLYVFEHVEKNKSLVARFNAFLRSAAPLSSQNYS